MLEVFNDIFDLVWDVSQTNKIEKLNREVQRLKQAADASAGIVPIQRRVDVLRASNVELRLYVAVLCRVLNLQGIIRRDELAKLIAQVDGEDGRSDNAHAEDLVQGPPDEERSKPK